MRISDWSSDVCSSDLFGGEAVELARLGRDDEARLDDVVIGHAAPQPFEMIAALLGGRDRPACVLVALVEPAGDLRRARQPVVACRLRIERAGPRQRLDDDRTVAKIRRASGTERAGRY